MVKDRQRNVKAQKIRKRVEHKNRQRAHIYRNVKIHVTNDPLLEKTKVAAVMIADQQDWSELLSHQELNW